MRKFVTGLMILVLVFVVLACGNAPVTVEQPGGIKPPPTTGSDALATDTPPAVTVDVATATASLTPTPLPATPTPVVDVETATPVLMCTPPLCATDETYYCPGDCPGGCGTQCATLTPTPTPVPHSGPPLILSFEADKTVILEDEPLNVTWSVQGASEVALTWLGSAGTMDGRADLDPQGGVLAIAPHGAPVTLRASNAEGFAELQLDLVVACAHNWVPDLSLSPPSSGCPLEPVSTWAAQQPFEGGFMLWLEAEESVYVFFYDYGGQSYRVYPNIFQDGDMESDPSLVPPAGLEQPVRGFGQIWRDNPEVRDNLGWATASESGFETWKQSYQGFGMHNLTIWLKDIDQNINQLTPMGSVWEIYSP